MYIVARRNPYARIGTFFDKTEYGFEKLVMSQEGGRAVPLGYEEKDLVIPHYLLEPYVVRLQARGFDDRTFRNDMR